MRAHTKIEMQFGLMKGLEANFFFFQIKTLEILHTVNPQNPA